MIPEGSPGQVRAGAQELAMLARDMDELGQQLRLLVRAELDGVEGWQGAAAQAYSSHAESRLQVLKLAEQALDSDAGALEEYTARLERAQETYRQGHVEARAAGLAFLGDVVNPASLLPPDPQKLRAAAEFSRELAAAEAAGLWASSELSAALEAQEQLAQKAEWLLGDRSGLSPLGFVHDLFGAPAKYLWEMGTGMDALAGAVLMAALGDPIGLEQLEREGQSSLRYAEAHPAAALKTLLGADEIQDAFDDGHPGQAAGLLGTSLAMTLNPDSEETRGLKAVQEEERLAAEQQLAEQRIARLHAELGEVPRGTELPQLPNADRAIIDPRKFSDYSMNPLNTQNEGKWEAFATLGYDIQSADGRSAAGTSLGEQVRSSLASAPAVADEKTKFGPRCIVNIEIVGPNGRHATLVTVWQYDSGADAPRLITTWAAVHG
jgi:hypothetical protein